MNFFQPACQEPMINHTEFGICDDNVNKAYTTVVDPETWIGVVKNPTGKDVVFTAIDNCVIKRNEEIGHGRCDAMLTTNKHLYLVELKEVEKSWQTGAIEQLTSTIRFLKANHDLSNFRHKKAFACNKKHPYFQVIDNDLNKKLFREQGFRIDIQAEIIVI